MKKFRSENLVFKKLKVKHKHLLKTFQTFQNELKKYLIEDALESEDLCISNTYLIFLKNKKNLKLVAYVTISTDSINLDNHLKKRFREKGIQYKSLPALKIGRICVENSFLRRGIGKIIINWTIKHAIKINENIACRFITLDAKRNEIREKDSFHFYTKVGFIGLKKRNRNNSEIYLQKSGVTPMYLDLYHLIRAYKIKKEKKE